MKDEDIMPIGEFGGVPELPGEGSPVLTTPMYWMYELGHASLNPARAMFDATKLAEFSRQAPHADVTILPGETHLSLLDTAAASVGPWLQRQSASGR